jgi:hypothetical protein
VGSGKVLPPDKNTVVSFDMVNPPLEFTPRALAISATCLNCVCLGPGGACDVAAASWDFPQLVGCNISEEPCKFCSRRYTLYSIRENLFFAIAFLQLSFQSGKRP